MNVVNDTPFVDGLALGMGPDRRSCLAPILKATFRMPGGADGAPAPVADEQLPITADDEFYKGDVTGSIRLESDAVPFKPRADVVLVGRAYAPGGKPVPVLDAGLRVGRAQQAVRVFGDRRWVFPTRLVLVPVVSDPEPFTEMPLVYERAFGGFDHKGRAWCAQNHVGRGFIGKKTRESVDGKPLPNLEDPRRPIRSWDDQPAPVGFGFYGRSWQPRAALTGRAVDDLDAEFGLPADFDFGFYNGAHPALQVPGYLAGNEEVELRHLTPDGYRRFRLPGLRPRVTLRLYDGAPDPDPAAPDERPASAHPVAVHLDTLVLFPDDGVLTAVWRGHHPLPGLALDTVAGIDYALT
jgi:hypothetical protein